MSESQNVAPVVIVDSPEFGPVEILDAPKAVKPAKVSKPKVQTGPAVSHGNARKVEIHDTNATHFRNADGRVTATYLPGEPVGRSKSRFDVRVVVVTRQDEKGKADGYDVRIGAGKSSRVVVLDKATVKSGRLALGQTGKGRTGHDVIAILAGLTPDDGSESDES